MADYVLVHGAWGGSHSYDRTAEDLRAAGHRVLVAQLRGLGTRQAELHPGITLTDHVDDVCEQIAAAGFGRFVLVGHSYGGMVVTGVAARLGGRIDAIAYLDAFLPDDGESVWDITGNVERSWYISSQKDTPGLVAPIGSLNFQPVPGRVGRHPLLTMLEAVRYTGEETKIPRRAYVFATGWDRTPFRRFSAKAQGLDGWDHHECDAGHFVMTDQPEQVRDILLGLSE